MLFQQKESLARLSSKMPLLLMQLESHESPALNPDFRYYCGAHRVGARLQQLHPSTRSQGSPGAGVHLQVQKSDQVHCARSGHVATSPPSYVGGRRLLEVFTATVMLGRRWRVRVVTSRL